MCILIYVYIYIYIDMYEPIVYMCSFSRHRYPCPYPGPLRNLLLRYPPFTAWAMYLIWLKYKQAS